MTFGGHLEVLRRMLFRIIAVAGILAIVVFCFKDITWHLLPRVSVISSLTDGLRVGLQLWGLTSTLSNSRLT